MTSIEGRTVDNGRESLLTRFRLALSFLTILPLGPRHQASAEAVSSSYELFPLVGIVLGALLAVANKLFLASLGPVLTPILVVLIWTVVTGGLHLDGVADTADALAAGSNRERALEILRDSRIGTYGAIAIFFSIALKCASLAQIPTQLRWRALILAPTIGRWAMVAISYRMEYLRSNGAGSTMLGINDARALSIASLVTAGAAVILFSRGVAPSAAAAVVAVICLRKFYQRWLGGVTGDLLGAAGELTEIVVLIAIAIASR